MLYRSPARRLLSAEDEAAVLAAIAEAERRTSGEVRVHVVARGSGDPLADARRWFGRLGMERTRERNGVLLYVAALDRSFAIAGDRGIHERVGEPFWAALRDEIQSRFRQGLFRDGLVRAISRIGDELAGAFPKRSDDQDELPNAISFDEGER